MPAGIKTLTADNWLEVDSTSKLFVKISHRDGSVTPMSGEDWISSFLNPKLENAVPENVRVLFEVARGALAYGYFFYPLYSLAGDQLFRVAEAAISEKCRLLGGPDQRGSFNDKINFLGNINAISPPDRSDWHTIRQLRNSGSHPERQRILPPGAIAGILGLVADKINTLFK
jgi:hypothetical protein